ncbi:hypothetical protein GCM10007147_27730 [Nocardiopsis kunsanensis]|uniref:Uncharacterized protein n=1 Tax=Nocardiopsis kunsanensis TaxID=141693 RepID=A0A918XE74_9ACTN|nr:hypothetical protein [Nocardiopsis kunsanensis]GHD28085.1 hypothetical protein GCM10007147_27730 [Nocardiopsis kunsanensis]
MSRRISPTAPSGTAARISLEGVGDVVDAGSRSGYAHLRERRAPTLGRLCSAARDAAAVLAAPSRWPERRGRWQPAPRHARLHAGGGMRVSVVALEPNSFVAGTQVRGGRSGSLEVLHLVGGRAHLIDSGPDGWMRSAAELAPGRTRVVGAPVGGGRRGHQFLVNTGDEVAVVLRVTA